MAGFSRGEIEALADVHDLAVASDLDRVAELMAGPLSRYVELELRSDGARVDVVTLSEKNETGGFFELLTERGVPESRLTVARSLARFGLGAVLGMKVPVAGPCDGGELYIRRGLPVQEVAHFLSTHGVRDEVTDRLRRLGTAFDKDYTHILACDTSDVPTFTVFFTTYLEPGHEPRDEAQISAALGLIGMSTDAIDATMRQHRFVGASRPGTLFLSSRVRGGELMNMAKLDYVGARLGVVTQLMADVCGPAEADRVLRWAEELRTNHSDYVGLVLDVDGPQAVRVYFTRLTGLTGVVP